MQQRMSRFALQTELFAARSARLAWRRRSSPSRSPPMAWRYRTALVVDQDQRADRFPAIPEIFRSLNFDTYCAANTFTQVQFSNGRHNDFRAFSMRRDNQFVAPVSGVYALCFRVMFKANAAVPTIADRRRMYKNGSRAARLHARCRRSSRSISNRTIAERPCGCSSSPPAMPFRSGPRMEDQ